MAVLDPSYDKTPFVMASPPLDGHPHQGASAAILDGLCFDVMSLITTIAAKSGLTGRGSYDGQTSQKAFK
jgi:hypothetical protein